MIAKINDNIFLSGANEVLNYQELKALRIDVILNVADNINDPIYTDIVMVKIPIHEFESNPKFIKDLAVLTLRTAVQNGCRVLVHCKAGAHRSPYIIFTYLQQETGKTLDQINVELQPKIPWKYIYPQNIP